MYLHIGGGVVLRSCELIGLFDFDGATRSKGTRDYLRRREKEGFLVSAHGDDLPRTIAVTDSDKAVLSPVTTETLYKRFT